MASVLNGRAELSEGNNAKGNNFKSNNVSPLADFTCVVKLFVSRARISYKMPWQRKAPENCTGSGFLLDDKRIITNCHVVQDNTSILVRRHGSARKYQARVLCMGWQCDLALLTVDDDRFWEKTKVVSLGSVPQLRDAVSCVGYPTGGDNLSITCGVVSRVDVHYSSHCHTALLTVQIDAAINSGNSGGPVFSMDNREPTIVGVAFLNRSSAQNIGYIIPIPVVIHFLEDYEKNGSNSLGFCSDVGFNVQHLENRALRRYHGMDDEQSGVVVKSPAILSPFYGHLLEGDVLLEIDGESIGDDGTITFRRDERIRFGHLFSKRHVGDKLNMKVLRNKEVIEIGPVTLKPCPNLVPRLHNYDCYPSYYIVGGLCFSPLTGPLLSECYSKWRQNAPTCLAWHYWYGNPKTADSQVVVLNQLMSSDLTIGYSAGVYNSQLIKFDGKPVKNIKQLAIAIEKFLDPYRKFADVAGGDEQLGGLPDVMRFDIGEPGVSEMHIVLDPIKVVKQSEKILETYHIRRKCCAAVEKALETARSKDDDTAGDTADDTKMGDTALMQVG